MIRDRRFRENRSRVVDPVGQVLEMLIEKETVMVTTIGLEVERMLTGPDGPADTNAVLCGGYESKEYPFEAVMSDMGRSSVELITTPCRNEREVADSLKRCVTKIPPGYSAVPVTRMPDPITLASKSRVAAMIAALDSEKPGSGRSVYDVGAWNSTQLHIGVLDIFDPSSILLMNVLTNVAPYARLKVLERHGLTAPGHMMIWEKITEKRIPRSRWFTNLGQLMSLVESLPKLLTKVDGVWVPAQSGTMSSLRDSESIGTIWWAARPRADFSTHEWRPGFPSLPDAHVVELADEVFRLVRVFWQYREEHPKGSLERSSKNVYRLYARLSRETYLIPQRPLDDDRWWQLFHR